MSKILKIFILLGMAFPAHSAQHRFYRCAKFLESMRYKVQSKDSQQTIEKQGTIGQLHQFKARELNDFDFTPTNQSVNADHNSLDRTKAKVARRLSAIINEAQEGQKNDLNQTIISQSFVGEQEILLHLNLRQVLLNKVIEATSGEISANLFWGHIVLPLFSYGIFDTIISLSPLIVLATYLRTYPEVALRYFSLYDYRQISEKQFEKIISEKHPNGWYYRSFDEQLAQHHINMLWQRTSNSYSDALTSFTKEVTHPGLTRKVTGSWFSAKSVNRDSQYPKMGWIRVDELLSFDPETNEPVLSVVLRISADRKKYPKKAPAPAKEKLKFGERPVLAPLTINN